MKPTKKSIQRQNLLDFLEAKEGYELTEYEGHLIIFHYTPKGFFALAHLEPKKAKLNRYEAFTTREKRNEVGDNIIKRIDRELAEDLKRKELGKEISDKIKVGSIFYSSWGWEQTNIDFFKVVAKTNSFVTLVQIGENKVVDYNHGDRGTTTPNVNEEIGLPFKRKVSESGWIKIKSFMSATLMEDVKKPKSWTSYA